MPTIDDRMRLGVILEALPDDVPQATRMRRALKSLLRCYRIRARLFVAPESLPSSELVEVVWREEAQAQGKA